MSCMGITDLMYTHGVQALQIMPRCVNMPTHEREGSPESCFATMA